MLNLPTAIMALLEPFRLVFQLSTWHKVQVLLVGTLLAPGKRTVTSALRAVGLADEPGFSKYHQVLNRAVWSSRRASQVLLRLLLEVLAHGSEPWVFGIDETIERRWGSKIQARGIYRDAVRSSHSHFVKTSGLRWISLMWLTKIPWAQRIWALPFLTVLAPSERYYKDKVRSYKKLTDWARQMIYQLRRWLPGCELIVVGDNTYAVLDLLHACQMLAKPVTLVTRLRLDAALYEPAPPYAGMGRPRKKGRRLPTLESLLNAETTRWMQQTVVWYQGALRPMEIATGSAVWYHTGKPPVPIRWLLIRDPQGCYDPIALLCTNAQYSPQQIIEWFVRRWSMEVTFEESRSHLGVETQRQWSDLAILRTTPALLGLFSWVTLVAHSLFQTQAPSTQQTAWYTKSLPTFADALASVRHLLWFHPLTFCISSSPPDIVKVPRPLFDRLVNSLCFAA
jgi:hypothetical protein